MLKAIAAGAFAGFVLYVLLHLYGISLPVCLLLGGLIGAVSHLHTELRLLQRRFEAAQRTGDAAPAPRSESAPLHDAQAQVPPVAAPVPPRPAAAEPVRPAVPPKSAPLTPPEKRAPVKSGPDPFVLLVRYLSGGNPLVRIGGVVLFFGLAFLAKYAADLGLLSIQLRLLGIAAAGFALIVIGWRLRDRPNQYGLIVQGVGIATLYLVIFSWAKLYGLMPLNMAFVLMFLTVGFGTALALRQDSLPMTLFATAGGFLVPILTSSGSGSHVVLFSYYALLNLGIVIIAWQRTWRILNVTGFLFTFVIAAAWGVLRYQSELLETTEPFLVLFFFFYLGITILFTSKQPFELRGFIDSTLVFGVPLATFAFQNALVREIEYALSFSALFMGGLYLFLAKLLWRKPQMRLLSEAFLALSVVFVTLAVPYALDGHWTAATWSLEAAAIVWIGLRQQRLYARLFGMALQIVSALLFVSLSLGSVPTLPFANGIFLGGLTVAFASLFVSWLYTRYAALADPRFEAMAAALFLALGLLWWFLAGARDVDAAFRHFGNGMLIYAAAGAGLFSAVASWLRWDAFKRALQGYAPLGLACYVLLFPYIVAHHPFKDEGFVAFVAFFTLHYLLLYRHEEEWRAVAPWHVGGLWLLGGLLSLESAWQIGQIASNTSYRVLAYAAAPLLLGVPVMQRAVTIAWPLQRHAQRYRVVALAGFALFLLAWEFFAFAFNGNAAPLPFIPLLNPLEAGAVLVVAAVVYWYRENRGDLPPLPHALLVSALFALLFISVSIGRAVHFYAHVPYRFEALWGNPTFQTALSLLWTAIAFGIILLARRLANRLYWISGATLLGAVILKLFLIDLSNSGTLERIISFIAVGILALLIGYIAPLPPSGAKTREEQETPPSP